MPVAAVVSFRLGGPDGVSVEAEKWGRALRAIGFSVVTVAGGGPVDRLVPGLAIDAAAPPDDRELRDALAGAGVVVVENLCSLPLNVPAAEAVARVVLGVGDGERLVLHPTRAIPRKNVPAAVAMAEALGAVYWLPGPAEEGYGPELDRLLAAARVPVRRGLPEPLTMADAYAAADAVVYPSRWEGFGNPAVESAVHRRPLAIGDYPVASELRAYGFRWFPADDPAPLAAWLADPDPSLLDHNHEVARRHFSMDALVERLGRLLGEAGWAP